MENWPAPAFTLVRALLERWEIAKNGERKTDRCVSKHTGKHNSFTEKQRMVGEGWKTQTGGRDVEADR